MGVGEDFRTFCSALAPKNGLLIALRRDRITKRLNATFWRTDSETAHTIYLGSYGRGTAIDGDSDVDMLFTLPPSLFEQYSGWQTNGQSGLLQAVKSSIQQSYPNTASGADGQVVVVPFTDGVRFEVLPAFRRNDGAFVFADSNDGGSWEVCDPIEEMDAINRRNDACNGNLKRLGRMARAWRSEWQVPISGLLIDTLAYQFIGDWTFRSMSYSYYDWMSRDFFDFLGAQDRDQEYWRAPGSGQYVWRDGSFESKALASARIARVAIEYEREDMHWSARQRWREIYGTRYPS